MNSEAKAALIVKMQEQACALLDENRESIFEAYETLLAERDDPDDKKFKFPISLNQDITGDDPETYRVHSKLSFKITTKSERMSLVRTGRDLVDDMNEAAGAELGEQDFDEEVDLDAEAAAEEAEASEVTKPKRGGRRGRKNGKKGVEGAVGHVPD